MAPGTDDALHARHGNRCRVVVADDHAIVRDGLCAILRSEPDIEVVGAAEDGSSVVALVGVQQPDVVVLDLSMPRYDGVHAIQKIKRRYPRVRVVVLTFHKEDLHIHAALEAGTDAYVLKDEGREELLAAIRNVSAGRSYLSPAICGRVMDGYRQATFASAAESTLAAYRSLNSRERAVLKLVAEGCKTREIADYLSLSTKTVEKHRTNMMRKLGLKGVSAVTAYALENKLLSE